MSHLLLEGLAGVSSGSQEEREGVRRSAKRERETRKIKLSRNYLQWVLTMHPAGVRCAVLSVWSRSLLLPVTCPPPPRAFIAIIPAMSHLLPQTSLLFSASSASISVSDSLLSTNVKEESERVKAMSLSEQISKVNVGWR